MRPHVILLAALLCLLHMTEALQENTGFSFNTNSAMRWLNEFTKASNEGHSRKKRAIGLPPGSNVEVKWSLNFPFDTFTFYQSKVQLALPIKIPFPAGLIVGGGDGKKRSDSIDYDNIQFVERQEVAPQWYQPADVSQQEWHYRTKRAARQERTSVYGYLEALFEKAGEDGRSCLLRTICDVAEAPFSQGLLGEMINTLLTASLAGRPESEEEGKEYDRFIEAELHGKLNGKCQERYNKCKTSPFDLIPYVQHTVI